MRMDRPNTMSIIAFAVLCLGIVGCEEDNNSGGGSQGAPVVNPSGGGGSPSTGGSGSQGGAWSWRVRVYVYQVVASSDYPYTKCKYFVNGSFSHIDVHGADGNGAFLGEGTASGDSAEISVEIQ